jgi:hypothetical protein
MLRTDRWQVKSRKTEGEYEVLSGKADTGGHPEGISPELVGHR